MAGREKLTNISNKINSIFNMTTVVIVTQGSDKICIFITKMYILLILEAVY